MGFPQLETELRWYPHRRRRMPKILSVFTPWADQIESEIMLAYCAGIVLYIYGIRALTLR